tara:strand:+ start:418 stop:921 length:504 start_codon:yes stop_codon:yes gene_type:complete
MNSYEPMESRDLFKDKVKDVKEMITKIEEYQPTFINDSGKYQLDLENIQNNNFEEDAGKDEILDDLYNYVLPYYTEVTKKRAILYIKETMKKMRKDPPSNLEDMTDNELLKLQEIVSQDYDIYKIIKDQRKSKSKKVGLKKRNKSKRRGSKKSKSTRKNKRKLSKKK